MLGKYRLERLLGAGGMGEVWAAHDPDLDRRVALKVLRRELATNDGARARLQREGRAMARLRHPNVITVHEAVFSDGRGVIAMELIDGQSLAGWLSTRPDRRAVIAALVAAGRGLAAAHAAGMVHRDFKPHNVLVDRDGRVVVTDFGLARATGVIEDEPGAEAQAEAVPVPVTGDEPTVTGDDDTVAPITGDDDTVAPITGDDDTVAPALAETAVTPSGQPTPTGQRTPTRPSAGELHSPLTLTGELLGTPAYMAPEQITGGVVDDRSDQFAFCVTAWEALAGRRPFTGKNLGELTAAVLHGVPTGGDAIPARLRSILERGMARAPDARWPAMPELLRAFERAWRRPRRIAVGAIAIAAVATLVAGGIVLRRSGAASPCVPADRALASLWSPAIRASVAEHLGTGPQADHVLAFFDGWRDTWTAIDRATCKQPDAPDFAARRSCLDSLRDEVAITLGAMQGLPQRIMLYLDWPVHVAPPDICATNPRAIAPTTVAGTDPSAAIALRKEMIVASVKVQLDHEEVDFAPFVARARALGSGVLVAEALMRQAEVQDTFSTNFTEQAVSCATDAEAAGEAERAGHDRFRAMALIMQLKCETIVDAPLAQRIDIAHRLDSVTARLGDPAVRALADNEVCQVEIDTGQWTAAIDRLERARGVWIQLSSLQGVVNTTVHQAEARALRHLGDDHAVAIERMQKLDPVLRKMTAQHEVTMLAIQLGPLLWMTGDFAGAMPYHKVVTGKTAGATAVAVAVRVTGPGAAAAEVIAAIEPDLDPTRLAMSEYDGAVPSGTTDANGAIALQAPVGGVIVARAGDAIGVAPVPDHGGRVAIELAPGQPLTGTVTGFAAIATDDPAPAARAARRQVPVVYITTVVAGRALTWHVPVAVADGSWRSPPLPPGRYVVAADVTSAFGDDQTAQTIVEVGATPPPPGIALALPAPAPAMARVILRPAIAGRVAIVPAGPLPATWAAATERFARAATLSMADIGEPLRQDQLVDGSQTGDAVVDLAVLTARPAVVCVLPDARSTLARSLWRIIPGANKTPPICRALPATDEPVVIETR